MSNTLIPVEDQERQVVAFLNATEGFAPRVLAQIRRRTGVAVQFHPEQLERLTAGGILITSAEQEGYPTSWACFGVPIEPGDYIVNVSGEGIRIVARSEFEQEWEVLGDA